MARGSGSSGGSYSYRQWAAAERAAQRERDQRQRQAVKGRQIAEAVARDEEAVEKTAVIERRVAKLEGLYRQLGLPAMLVTCADVGQRKSQSVSEFFTAAAPR